MMLVEISLNDWNYIYFLASSYTISIISIFGNIAKFVKLSSVRPIKMQVFVFYWIANFIENMHYSYDSKSNITEVRINNELIARYQYDGLSRIIREDNKKMNKTSVFSYDAGGNITQRLEFPFTLITAIMLFNDFISVQEKFYSK